MPKSGTRLSKYAGVSSVLAGIVIAFLMYTDAFNSNTDALAPSDGVTQLLQAQVRIVARFERPANRFTQGLTFYDDKTLLESTGLYGSSCLRKVHARTHEVLQEACLSDSEFGEGCAVVRYANGTRHVFMLTWRERVVYVHDGDNISNVVRRLELPAVIKEGWGLCAYDSGRGEDGGEQLIVSDGTSTLYFLDAQTFTVVRTLEVYTTNSAAQKSDSSSPSPPRSQTKRIPLNRINELEIYQGKLLANIFMTHMVAVIDLQSGHVTKQIGFYELTQIVEQYVNLPGYWKQGAGNCLNGIAYNNKTDTLLMTGKNWPLVFEVKVDNL